MYTHIHPFSFIKLSLWIDSNIFLKHYTFRKAVDVLLGIRKLTVYTFVVGLEGYRVCVCDHFNAKMLFIHSLLHPVILI